MTAKRTQVGLLAVGLLAMLVAFGCMESSDLISSGNVIVTYPTSLVNPSGTDYSCIRMDYSSLKIKVTDGVCSADSGVDFAGKPCGTDTDCSDIIASCDETFGTACDSGLNQNQPCVDDDDCAGNLCVPQGECASFPGGFFTGQGCISDLDCTPGSGEKCAGRCSAGSTNSNGACITAGDCTTGECEGAQATDSTEGDSITMLNQRTAVYFTPTCPACELDKSSPVFCDPANPVRCTNECLTAAELDLLDIPCISTTGKCCQKFDLVAPSCETTADCPINRCVESAQPLASDILPEGKYAITEFEIDNLRMFVTDGSPLISCGTKSLAGQYDPPLDFELGPGRSNAVQFVIDESELESKLGLPGPADCDGALDDFPAWFAVVSQ